MKLLTFFYLFYLFLFAQAHIGYDEYVSLAETKQWSTSPDAFQAFIEYCNDPISSPPSMLPDVARSDCSIFFATTNDHISHTVTTTKTTKASEPDSKKITSTVESNIATTSAQASYTIKDIRFWCPETKITSTPTIVSLKETTKINALSSTTLLQSQGSTSSEIFTPSEKIEKTKSVTSSDYKTTTTTLNDPTIASTVTQTSTTKVDVITTKKPTTLTESTSTATNKETQTPRVSYTIKDIRFWCPESKTISTKDSLKETTTTSPISSTRLLQSTTKVDVITTITKLNERASITTKPTVEKRTSTLSPINASPFTDSDETSKLQTVTPPTQLAEPPLTTSPLTHVTTEIQVSDSTTVISFESTTVRSLFDTTTVSLQSEQSTTPTETGTDVTSVPSNPDTAKRTTFETSEYVSEEERKTTLIQTPQVSTTPSTSSVLPTNANKRSTVSDDEISAATVTAFYPYSTTTTSTPLTSTAIKSVSTTQVTESYKDESSSASTNNAVTETQSHISKNPASQVITFTSPSYSFTSSSYTGFYTTTTKTPTTRITMMETSTIATSKTAQTISTKADIPSTQVSETTTTESYTTITPSVPKTQTTTVASNENLRTVSSVTDIPSTQVQETTTTKAHVTVNPSISTTQKNATVESSPFVNPMLHTATSSAPIVTESKIATRSTKSGTYTSKLTTTTSLTTVKETTVDKKSTEQLIDETLSSLVTSSSKTQSSTISQAVIEEQETTTAKKVTSETAPLTKLTTQETTVFTSSSFSTTKVSDNKQIAETSTKQSDLITTTNVPSSSTDTLAISSAKDNYVTIKSTITLEQILASSPVQPFAASTTSSASTTSTTENPPTTSTTGALLPTKEPVDCTMPCPYEFLEGDYACFKFIQPKDGKAWKYSDFKNACDSVDGIVASFSDFEYVQNMELFKKIALSKKMNLTTVFINTVPTPNIAARKVINGIDLTKSNSTKISIIQLSSGKKYTSSTAVCRVGKFCEEYTCPIREFFLVESARYFETAAPLTTVLKAGDSLNVECVGTPKRTFQLECDRRGYLIPDSSMLKCEGSGIKSEVVKSCGECDIQQTESCQVLKNGSFSCKCKQSYFGQTCKNIVNACSNYTCKNGGTCINEYSNAKCQCQTSHFGDRCQYNFYKSEGPARVMRALTNAAVVIVIIDEVVRTRQKYIIPASGKTGTLPTEVCRFYTTMMGAMAFIMKLVYEFPDSGKMEEKYFCQTHFEITITFVFLSLSGMLAESVISLGVITNKWTNQFKGRCKDRKNCISTGKLFIFISTIAIIPTAIIWQNSSLLVTPRSCIGTLPWENASDQKQMAAMLLVVLMTFYATTASCIALFARQFIDQNNLETRRRYDCDRTNPFAYGREILPIENNVRYYLLALRPILFALNWFCFIASTELMVKWVSGLSTVVGLSYSVVNFLQNNFAFKKDLEGWIYTAMGWLPKEYSPAFNRVSLHSRKDYLRIYDPEALEAEEAKLIKQRDQYLRSKYPIDRDFEEAKVAWSAAAIINYPIVYEQPIEHLMLADRNRWLNATALRIMMPAGLRAVIQKQWTLIYLRARAAGRTRSGAMSAIFKQLQPPRLFTYGYRRSIFNGMYKVFWQNMTIVDQLDGVKDVDRKKVIEVFQKGVQMLTIKPNRKIELAEIWDPEHSDGRTLTFKRDDPLMNIDQQQKIYDMLENLCNSITSEMMEQDEANSRALFEGDPERYGIRKDILTENVFNNYPTSLMDFLLNEQRPNFIGPRTIENVLAPGVDHLQHTAWFWMIHNGLMWQRVTTQAKYLAFFIQIKKDNAEIIKNNNSWRNYWPWNWFNKNENVQQQANPEPEDDLHVEDPIGLN